MHFSLDVLKPIAMETIFGSLQVLFMSIHNIKEEKGREESMRTREAKVKAEQNPRY